jgi:hypothetical protein
MADERQRQLMQEALDQALSPDMLDALRKQLDGDPQGSQQFNRLKKVDDMLRSAPHERAPARLALGIMAKLAQTMNPKQVSSTSSAALALSLALVVLVALPVLTVAISLFLSAMGSAAALNAILQQIANLLALVVGMLDALVEGAQSVLKHYPQAPLLIITVAPIMLFWLLKAVEGDKDNEEKGR